MARTTTKTPERVRKERLERARVGLAAIKGGQSLRAVARAFKMSCDALTSLFHEAGLYEEYREYREEQRRNSGKAVA
jgi:hypothetical protein